jgi:flagellin-specific chaperone FliS
MLIAREKRKDNIVEYILYMYQVEDIIRACQLDIAKVKAQVIDYYKQPGEIKRKIEKWYLDIIHEMKARELDKSGHLQRLEEIMGQLYSLHKELLKSPLEAKYHELFQQALPNIVEFRKKTREDKAHDIQVCLNALYALLLMRLKKKEITRETSEAMSTFSNLLAYLARAFKKREESRE